MQRTEPEEVITNARESPTLMRVRRFSPVWCKATQRVLPAKRRAAPQARLDKASRARTAAWMRAAWESSSSESLLSDEDEDEDGGELG